ncbi:unnamed protein product [Mytilus coruscus]|uniref:Uncharacterized protein n=1 Tax=Mytilus coruscus TaxID=42192 RepID=A0A6J8BJB9_MYTCO|nr:unnamed protein product [Mytilus coruscus]
MVYGQNPSLITNHCNDHRLALACRDSYKNAKVVKRLDDTLYNLHKYYKYSCNHTKSLENVQKALGEPVLKVKKAKHHRWLSHGQAVRAIVTSYRAINIDLESNTISGDPVSNGMVKSMVDKTISLLNKMKSAQNDGPWQKTLSVIADECCIDVTKMDKFDSTLREPFLTELIDNTETRIKNEPLDSLNEDDEVLTVIEKSELTSNPNPCPGYPRRKDRRLQKLLQPIFPE